ncbi:MAG: penicillin-binding transpeptidase domain-containing protein [Saccharofermentanales bacterium]
MAKRDHPTAARITRADKANVSIQRAESDRRKRRRSGSNRYTILAGLIVVLLVVILGRTSYLQLFGSEEVAVPETVGSASSIALDAPRGDIVDANGVPLAVSDAVNRVYLVSSNMDNDRLNAYLLDIATLFHESGVAFNSPLLTWLDVHSDDRDAPLLTSDQPLRFVYRQPYDEIVYWQTDRDRFRMVLPENVRNERQRQRMVRDDPNDLFEYLLYDFFKIEPHRSSGSRLYTDGEAFLIMQLRYLILENNWLFQNLQPIVLADAVPEDFSSLLMEQNDRFPGVVVTRQYERRYTAEARWVGHALGYVGAISSSEYARLKSSGYGMRDVVGKSGVEQAAERYLRGEAGIYTLDRWREAGGHAAVTYPGHMQHAPRAGYEVKMTIDTDLNRVAREELERKIFEYRGSRHKDRIMEAPSGCVVVMDAKTGAILASANYPDFDPADFVNQGRDPAAAARVRAMLSDTENRPLVNRVIGATYTPGSTFKTVTGMAALEAGVVTPTHNVHRCNYSEEIGGIRWYCYAYHGDLTFPRAMATSCNLYFFNIAVDTGIDRISALAEKVGLGELPGVDIAGEVAGIRPSREVKAQLNARPEDKTWFIADTCQTSIGQFYNQYSVMQLARAVGAMTTNTLVTPHYIKEIVAPNGDLVVPEKIERVDMGFDPINVQQLRDAMYELSQSMILRTGRLFHDFPIRVACKTGTAETYNEDLEPISNSVFVCAAPADDPEIVIAHAISDGAYGEYASDISYRILCEYFDIEPTHPWMGTYDVYRGR